MKRRIMAVVCAMVLVLGMTMTASAAVSPDAEGSSPSAGSNSGSSSSSSGDEVYTRSSSGQAITKTGLSDFAARTTISGVAGAEVRMVGTNVAMTLTDAANSIVGANAVIATMVDIQVPAGTGTATFTLGVPGLVRGQSVTVLHLKSNGEVEVLPVSAVGNGSVTFTMTSYSPVAVVVNATAPRTADTNVSVMLLLAMAGLAGAVVYGRKYQKAI